jgi:hypothetical protein
MTWRAEYGGPWHAVEFTAGTEVAQSEAAAAAAAAAQQVASFKARRCRLTPD